MLIKKGDEVAILPSSAALPSQVLSIVTVRFSGDIYVELEDGRMFAALGGLGLNTGGCIVPARAEHRAALQKALQSTVN